MLIGLDFFNDPVVGCIKDMTFEHHDIIFLDVYPLCLTTWEILLQQHTSESSR